MKKLQVTLLMSLALGSYTIYSKEDFDTQDFDAMDIKQAQLQVIEDLAEQAPEVLHQIIDEEQGLHGDGLEDTFTKLRNFVSKKIKEIEKLSAQNEIQETQIARIAIELADAQVALARTIEKQRAKHRKNHKLEQKIKDALLKAEQSLKILNDKALALAHQSVSKVQEFAANPRVQAAKEKAVKFATNAKDTVRKKAEAAKKNAKKKMQDMKQRSKKVVAQADDAMMEEQVEIQSLQNAAQRKRNSANSSSSSTKS